MSLPADRPSPADVPSSASLSKLLDEIRDGVFHCDRHGRLTYVNAGWRRLTGIAPSEAVGRELSAFVHADDRSAHESRLRALLEGRRATVAHDVRLATLDDEPRWVEFSAHAESDEQGVVTGATGTFTDVTARRAMEDELRTLAGEAEEARADAETAAQHLRAEVGDLAREHEVSRAHMHAGAEFVVSMAHDLRTPLNGVLGMTELLLHSPLSDEQRDQALTVRTSAESLWRLVEDILEVTRGFTADGNAAPRCENFELRSVVDDVSRLLKQKALVRGVEFRVQVDPDVPEWLHGDVARLRQAFTNVASNVMRVADEGGVAVAVSLLGPARDDGRLPLRITLRAGGAGAVATLVVHHGEGDGVIGLELARELIATMDGHVHARVAGGETAEVAVDLPLLPGAAPATAGRGPEVPSDLPPLPLEVLLAEDNTVNQKVASRMLTRWGASVDVVADGQAAVDALAARTYDVVLMDVRMPRLDGLQATTLVRRRELGTGRRTPIVAMTANVLSGDRELCLQAGMDGFVAKPIQPGDLYAELTRWLPDAGREPRPRAA